MRLGFRFNPARFNAYVQRAETALSPATSGPMQDGALAASSAYWGDMVDRFRSASAGDGTWIPLAPMTVAEHKRIGDGPPPHALRVTGRLEESMQRGAEGHVVSPNENGVVEGTQDPNARYQHSGTDGNHPIPPRPIIVQPNTDTLEKMKQPLVIAARRALKPNQALDANDGDLAAMFGIEII